MRMRWFWSLGISTIAGLALSAPALAQSQPSFNQSDVSGPGVANSSSLINAGAGNPESLAPVVGPEGTSANVITATQELIEEGGEAVTNLPTLDTTIARTKQLPATATIKPETKAALVQLRDYLIGLRTQGKPNLRAMDNNVRPVATNLSKDLAAADAACKAQGGTACEDYNRLATKTVTFLNALDTLDADLRRVLPIARTY